MDKILKSFIEEMKTSSGDEVIKRIKMIEPETVMVFAGGNRLNTIDSTKSNINLIAVVKKKQRYMRYPEYFLFKKVKVNVSFISISSLLEYYNGSYPLYPTNLSSFRTIDDRHEISLGLNFFNFSDEIVLYKNPDYLDACDFIKSNANHLAIVCMEDLIFYTKPETLLNDDDVYYDYTHLLLYYYYKHILKLKEINLSFISNIMIGNVISDIKDKEKYKKDILSLVKYINENEYTDNFRNELLDTWNLLNDNEPGSVFDSHTFDTFYADYEYVKSYGNIDLYLGKPYIIHAIGTNNFHYITSDGEEHIGAYKQYYDMYDFNDETCQFYPNVINVISNNKLSRIDVYDDYGKLLSSEEIILDDDSWL